MASTKGKPAKKKTIRVQQKQTKENATKQSKATAETDSKMGTGGGAEAPAERRAGEDESLAEATAEQDGVEVAPGQDGVDQLKDAADRVLAVHYKQLSKVILRKAKGGDMSSVRLLVLLSERRKPRALPVKKPRWRSLIMQLETEQEWVDPEEPKADSGQCAGNSEQVSK